ncbi:MAG TPA: hybrid sensor histidine kinase/response regulator, partial [Phycisphaerales bacterium]|nr:hybrid sensor histidine kinase/response regulator [Phycisphaerales bacterium]
LIDVSVTASPIRDASGRIIGASKVARDVTGRRRVQEEREKLFAAERAARAEAERLGRLKDEFLATLSHELRTPLSAVLGWAQLLRRPGAETATLQTGLEVIERNARAQVRLVDDMLDMSRVMAGKLQIRAQRVDLPALVRDAVESVRVAAAAKDLSVNCSPDRGRILVYGDPARLQQVVWNLLSNAVKFTPAGGQIDVSVGREGDQAVVRVADSGEGISPEFLPAVFDRFRQADAATTRRHGGLGLGLAIVKQMVEAHGGMVRAESAGKGKGAVFAVSLPVHVPAADAAAQPGAVAPAPPAAPPLAGARVLAVDDDPDARELVRRILTEAGAEVCVAAGGGEAFDKVSLLQPTVIVSDLGMPDLDGFGFLRKVRALPTDSGGNTPMIAHSALARPEDRQRALGAGFHGFVRKPLEPVELLAAVVAALGTPQPSVRLGGRSPVATSQHLARSSLALDSVE